MPLKMQPKKYEEKKDFNARCMNNAKMISEYGDRDQRFAVSSRIFPRFVSKENNMKHLRTLLKLPKLATALLLLLFFYLLETVMMVLYICIETPLSFILQRIERIIKYLVNTI